MTETCFTTSPDKTAGTSDASGWHGVHEDRLRRECDDSALRDLAVTTLGACRQKTYPFGRSVVTPSRASPFRRTDMDHGLDLLVTMSSFRSRIAPAMHSSILSGCHHGQQRRGKKTRTASSFLKTVPIQQRATRLFAEAAAEAECRRAEGERNGNLITHVARRLCKRRINRHT